MVWIETHPYKAQTDVRMARTLWGPAYHIQRWLVWMDWAHLTTVQIKTLRNSPIPPCWMLSCDMTMKVWQVCSFGLWFTPFVGTECFKGYHDIASSLHWLATASPSPPCGTLQWSKLCRGKCPGYHSKSCGPPMRIPSSPAWEVSVKISCWKKLQQAKTSRKDWHILGPHTSNPVEGSFQSWNLWYAEFVRKTKSKLKPWPGKMTSLFKTYVLRRTLGIGGRKMICCMLLKNLPTPQPHVPPPSEQSTGPKQSMCLQDKERKQTAICKPLCNTWLGKGSSCSLSDHHWSTANPLSQTSVWSIQAKANKSQPASLASLEHEEDNARCLLQGSRPGRSKTHAQCFQFSSMRIGSCHDVDILLNPQLESIISH